MSTFLWVETDTGMHAKIANGIIAFALCGLWHGAAVNFVLWGLYHGVGLTICNSYRRGSGSFRQGFGNIF